MLTLPFTRELGERKAKVRKPLPVALSNAASVNVHPDWAEHSTRAQGTRDGGVLLVEEHFVESSLDYASVPHTRLDDCDVVLRPAGCERSAFPRRV